MTVNLQEIFRSYSGKDTNSKYLDTV